MQYLCGTLRLFLQDFKLLFVLQKPGGIIALLDEAWYVTSICSSYIYLFIFLGGAIYFDQYFYVKTVFNIAYHLF